MANNNQREVDGFLSVLGIGLGLTGGLALYSGSKSICKFLY